jgi:serine/threonine protein phosphatase PrpC
MSIEIKMAAQCEAAGRPNNEDNFQLNDNLSNVQWGFTTDKVVALDKKGALLVVCDGMGGMNAGEVASASAIQTVKDRFAPVNISNQILESHDSIMRYIEKTIIAADTQIKEESKRDKEKEGMGSTIVMAWIVDKYVYVGWCGDSRAYRYNPAFGFEQLSHDHSYVQELVDAGKLSQELAFDHPNSNIITRSLGDSRQKAKPDVKCFPLYNGDVILLCSDGLSGVLRDSELEAIISQHTDSMEGCRNTLWNESKRIGWNDNVTIALCQIVSGAEKAANNKPINHDGNNDNHDDNNEKTINKRKPIKIAAFVLLLSLILFGMFEFGHYVGKKKFWLPTIEQKCIDRGELTKKIIKMRQNHRQVNSSSIMYEEITSFHLQLDSLEKDCRDSTQNLCDLSRKYYRLDSLCKKFFSQWRKELTGIIDTCLNSDLSDLAQSFKEQINKEDSIHLPLEDEKFIFRWKDLRQRCDRFNNNASSNDQRTLVNALQTLVTSIKQGGRDNTRQEWQAVEKVLNPPDEQERSQLNDCQKKIQELTTLITEYKNKFSDDQQKSDCENLLMQLKQTNCDSLRTIEGEFNSIKSLQQKN